MKVIENQTLCVPKTCILRMCSLRANKNPLSGKIYVPETGEIIMDDENARGEVIISGQDNCNTAKICTCA